MKSDFASRAFTTAAFVAMAALPSLAQAHPGVGGHTHALTPAISDAQTVMVVVVAVSFVAVAVWRSLRGSTK
ncbi:MAG: hypothetical protein RL380_1596 [Verrucomicrobiota bacterium]|jgi:hypothetical protein